MDQDKIKHLEFIQNVITRMNTNSFQLKGMAITIVAAFLAIYASTSNIVFLFLGIAPTILFWVSDAYCLKQERIFRGIYNNVAGVENDIEVEIKPFEMPIKKFKGGQYSYLKNLRSRTIILFYGIIIFLIFLSGIILKISECVTITFNCN
jgi:hypothetical protein